MYIHIHIHIYIYIYREIQLYIYRSRDTIIDGVSCGMGSCIADFSSVQSHLTGGMRAHIATRVV